MQTIEIDTCMEGVVMTPILMTSFKSQIQKNERKFGEDQKNE